MADSKLAPDPAASPLTKYGYWDPCPRVGLRIPSKEGLVLNKHIWKIYVIDRHRTCRYFDDQANRLLKRHPLNMRDVDGMAEEFADLIIKAGVQADKRGRPVLMPDRPDVEPGAAFTFREVEYFLLIGGGTMTDGVYLAASKAPLSPQVIATLEQGLEDCIILHPCTPTDIVTHIVASHNDFHLGSPSTFLQGSQRVNLLIQRC